MVTIELCRVGDKSVVVKLLDGMVKEYVVCSYYDGTKKYGDQWCWGHYFNDLVLAVEYFKEAIND